MTAGKIRTGGVVKESLDQTEFVEAEEEQFEKVVSAIGDIGNMGDNKW